MACRELAAVLAAMNLVGAALVAFDKWAARQHRHRIRERSLFLAAALGGWPMMLAFMLLLRHKTAKTAFLWRFAVAALVSLAWLAWAFSAGACRSHLDPRDTLAALESLHALSAPVDSL